MKKITLKKQQEQYRQWFYRNPNSRYNRFCIYCNHYGSKGKCEAFCNWYGRECFDAVRMKCPIPSAMVSMLNEVEARTHA